MRLIAKVVALVALLSFQPVAPAAQGGEFVAGTVIFRSDFDKWDGRWVIEGGKSTVWVEDGRLVLGLAMTEAGWVRQSRVETGTSFNFRYGTYRARMRFTGIKGAHPAAWAQSWSGYCDGCTEIDLVEHFGAPRVWHSLYWCPCPTGLQEWQASVETDPAAWNTYRVDWTPTGYTFYVDGVQTATWSDGLTYRPHYLILSYLVADWERDILQRDRLGEYRAYVEFVEVKANEWTELL